MKKGFDSEPTYSKKYLKIKTNLMKEKPTQIFMVITDQKKVFCVFVYQ